MESIQITKQVGMLRLGWDNRKTRKDRFAFWFLVVFWAVWAPITLPATVALLSGVEPWFFACWCVFGWLGTLLIPYALLGRWWCEWVELSVGAVTLESAGLLAPRPRTYPTSAITEIAL